MEVLRDFLRRHGFRKPCGVDPNIVSEYATLINVPQACLHFTETLADVVLDAPVCSCAASGSAIFKHSLFEHL